jgi:hypothetical protein
MWASWKIIILSMPVESANWSIRSFRIYNAEVNKHTHKLRVIKDYIKPII